MTLHQDPCERVSHLRRDLHEIFFIQQRIVVVGNLLLMHDLVVVELAEGKLGDVVDLIVGDKVTLNLLIVSHLLLLQSMGFVRSREDSLESLIDDREDNKAHHLHCVN